MTSLAHLTSASETELRRFFVAACTREFPNVRLFIRNVGLVELDGRMFKAGVAGMADCWGWLFPGPYPGWDTKLRPIPLEIELKNVKTPETKEQKAWAAYCRLKSVPYLQLRARKGETPEQVVIRWVEETRVWLTSV